jgi:hypothetical protein
VCCTHLPGARLLCGDARRAAALLAEA